MDIPLTDENLTLLKQGSKLYEVSPSELAGFIIANRLYPVPLNRKRWKRQILNQEDSGEIEPATAEGSQTITADISGEDFGRLKALAEQENSTPEIEAGRILAGFLADVQVENLKLQAQRDLSFPAGYSRKRFKKEVLK